MYRCTHTMLHCHIRETYSIVKLTDQGRIMTPPRLCLCHWPLLEATDADIQGPYLLNAHATLPQGPQDPLDQMDQNHTSLDQNLDITPINGNI